MWRCIVSNIKAWAFDNSHRNHEHKTIPIATFGSSQSHTEIRQSKFLEGLNLASCPQCGSGDIGVCKDWNESNVKVACLTCGFATSKENCRKGATKQVIMEWNVNAWYQEKRSKGIFANAVAPLAQGVETAR